MVFYYIRFTIVWTCWLIFADKSRWREILPVSFFASLLGAISDTIVAHYKLWDYDNGYSLIPYVLDDVCIYVVVTYLFIQWLPQNRTLGRMFGYWFVWTAISISVEWIHVYTGHLKYYRWWNIGCSYIADWMLFWIFYKYHQIFQFEKMSQK